MNIINKDLDNIFNREIPWDKLNNKTVLITGAYGMLATYLVYMLMYLNSNDISVNIIALVRSKEKFEKRFGKLDKYPFIKVYEHTLDCEINISEKIDYIIHAASLASPQYYSVCPIEVLKPNIIGNYHLLELADKNKVDGYLFFSSSDIYGVIENKKEITECDYGYMDTLDIHNCYSESKRMAETMCYSWYIQKGAPITIARIWHTYAPTMDIENDPRVFASFVNDIVHNRNIVMKSEGLAKRSFCYIADAIAGYFTILLKGKSGEAYNVCNTSQFCSIVELGERLVNLFPEKNLKLIKKERAKDEVYIENTIANFIPPSNKKLMELGWNCQYTIEDGFKNVITYFTKES